MKNILFYYSQLNIGGAEKSLIRLMNAFADKGDSVTYLGRYSEGAGEFLLDKRINTHWLSHPLSLKNSFSRRISMARGFIERTISKHILKRTLPIFDIAFIGLQGLSPEFVVNELSATKICVFIRSDISKAKQKNKIIENLKKYINEIDYFICVAETVKESLVIEIPEIRSKAIVVYNILAPDEMRHQLIESTNPFENEPGTPFRIVTICRMSDSSKALFRMVRVCRRLVDAGYCFKWYLVGEGPDLAALRQTISDNSLSDIMITPGKINNPFGFYRECDLVAMLSYYEGLCGVVNEAKVAGKAIIATEVSGIHEQLEHGVNGWIVDNDEDRIFDGMRFLLDHPDKVSGLTNKIYPVALLDDDAKIEKLYNLID